MKRCLQFFFLIFALSASVVLRADTDAEVNARKDALELAGVSFQRARVRERKHAARPRTDVGLPGDVDGEKHEQ